jgi:hypothetical protein
MTTGTPPFLSLSLSLALSLSLSLQGSLRDDHRHALSLSLSLARSLSHSLSLSLQGCLGEHHRHARAAPPLAKQGPSWGYFKSQFLLGLSSFGDISPQKRTNGSKNEPGIPPRRAFCGHTLLCVLCDVYLGAPPAFLKCGQCAGRCGWRS